MESAKNGIPELIDKQNAMVSKDRKDFIENTLYLLEHPVEAQIIGKNGKAMMDKYYSFSAWQDRLNQVLEDCVNKKKPHKAEA